ncbi:MAG: hypothetical protein IJ783_00955, partial [Kiritimatiellae bacterium]|nr:hypothetical protein [Kiritimatiellia bacterium]
DETLAAGDRLQWRRPPWEEPDVPTDWRVVFEDAHLLAVDKPAGLPGACGYFFRAASLRIPHPATGEPLVLSVPEER